MKKILIFFLLSLFLFNSCKEENNPAAPANTVPLSPILTAPANGETSVIISPILTWNASETAFFYNLQISLSDSFKTFIFDQNVGNVTTKLISGLLRETKYYWRVNATNTFGTSEWSNVYNFTTGQIPGNPILSAPADSAKGISISPTLVWFSDSVATSYILQISTSISFSSYEFNQDVGNDTSYQVTGLKGDKKYYWKVRASNIHGTSNPINYWSFRTETTPCPGIPTVTYEGKTYNTVQIGNQCWLKENLDVGMRINGNTASSNNGTIEKYCYNNNPANCDTFGGLYQWREAMAYSTTPGKRGICPTGWHIPTDAEFQTLITEWDKDGNGLKSAGQGTGSGAGTNTSGFSALLAGSLNYNGFINLGVNTSLWSSTKGPFSNGAWSLKLRYYDNNVSIEDTHMEDGHSVRCVKD